MHTRWMRFLLQHAPLRAVLLCPLDIPLNITPFGKASSSVGWCVFFRFLRFHIVKLSQLRGRRCTVVRAIAPRLE